MIMKNKWTLIGMECIAALCLGILLVSMGVDIFTFKGVMLIVVLGFILWIRGELAQEQFWEALPKFLEQVLIKLSEEKMITFVKIPPKNTNES